MAANNNNMAAQQQQDNNSPKNNGNRYQFDELSPTASVRNSYVDNPAMDPQVRLEGYDWEELEEQFAKRMEAFKAVEENIWQEWRDWGEVRRFSCPPHHTTHNPPMSRLLLIADALYLSIQVFKAWASTISVHDEDRASKRLRTRIAYTQNSEEALEAKRQHCRFLTGGGVLVLGLC